ncbi:MAG: hypothetical protein F6K00_27075 [Leptolyngbya sp. SIOISBB]|nr:hypothetical protein [Leptolyngbya sp. SIOISBB]
MAISIAVKSLASRAVREVVGDKGTRLIETSLAFSDVDQGPDGIVGRVISFLSRGTGWLAQGAWDLIQWGLSKINFGRIWGWIVNSAARIAVFDWNSTDVEITALQANNTIALFSTWGAATGAGLGWLTGIGVGYGLGMAVPVIGGATLAKAIAGATTAEAIDEIQAVLRSAITQTVSTVSNNTVLEGYKRLRGLIKRVPPNLLRVYFGPENADFILNEWGLEGSPTLTFAGEVETQIERIESDRIRAFVENAVEEYIDSFIEAGYVIANELDTAYQQTKLQEGRKGQTASRAVTIIPDVQSPHERIYVEGTEAEVKERAQQAITNLRVLGNRDVGEIVGQPIGDYLRAQPHRRKATITFKDIPGRATRRPDGTRARYADYTIPDLEQVVNWVELKRAVRPYNWGEFRATANLDNGRQMAVYGGTALEAEEKLRDLLTLSTADIVTLSVTQEKDRDIRVRKRMTRMYPYRLKLLVRRFDPDGSSYIDAEGNAFTDNNFTIPLWPDEAPPEFTQTTFI